ncbi:hypothetical protein CMV_001991 [Castanea mollissima]|uniref:Uncharacterized protein n=1 Tax=Castanea mollissima TaxID=60419 RepID=A0A8J4RJX1_9ROSI|nr:hypothetical protein CMV_001991 [Castanea mollissima]
MEDSTEDFTFTEQLLVDCFCIVYSLVIWNVFAHSGDIVSSWFERRAKKSELARIHHIIRKKGWTAKFMTLGELAEDLKSYGDTWSELAESE